MDMNLGTLQEVRDREAWRPAVHGVEKRAGHDWVTEQLYNMGFPGGSVVKNPPANAGGSGDVGLIPGLGRSLGGGSGKPLQYSCLGDAMNRRAWQATVHRVEKSWTREHTHMHWQIMHLQDNSGQQ